MSINFTLDATIYFYVEISDYFTEEISFISFYFTAEILDYFMVGTSIFLTIDASNYLKVEKFTEEIPFYFTVDSSDYFTLECYYLIEETSDYFNVNVSFYFTVDSSDYLIEETVFYLSLDSSN